MIKITIPFLGANDDSCVVVDIISKNGNFVKKGQLLFVIETTKSAIDVEAEDEGYFYSNISVGDRKNYGELVALISNSEINDKASVESFFNVDEITEKAANVRITKKAELIIKKENIDLESLTAFAKGNEINEALVLSFISTESLKNRKIGMVNSIQRIAIVGGVGGGGALIIADAVLNNNNQIVTGIYDNNESFHGKKILGIKILGGENEMLADYKEGKFDAIVIAFNKNLQERRDAFERYKSLNIQFANVIDKTVQIRNSVEIGDGNIILANSYIAACTVIGDNNFISSNVCLEHGNIVGSHNAFGPGVFTSGNVIIKNKIRFGTGVFIEPNLIVGDNVILGSFVLINTDIPDDTILKRKQDYIIKENK